MALFIKFFSICTVGGYLESISNIQAKHLGYSITDAPSSESANNINFFILLLN